MVAFAMSISFMSCKNEAGKDAASAEQKSTTENVEQKVDLVELVAKVKAEGANWSVDQWKDAFKSALIALKPMMETMSEFQAKLKGAKEEDAAKIMSELEAKSKEFEPIEKAMTEFEYTSLSGDMLDVKIYSKVDDVLAVIRIKFIEELNYPLMFVEEIIE